jgi:hypothetical protein
MITGYIWDGAFRSITALPLGTWLFMFGGLAELVAVSESPHPDFPHGRLITIRPVGGGESLSVLVPSDYVPTSLPRDHSHGV